MSGEWHDINEPGTAIRKAMEEDALVKELLSCPADTDQACDEIDAYFASQKAAKTVQEIRIHSLSWKHTADERMGADKARETDTIRLLCGVDGCADGTNIQFEMSWKDKSGNPVSLSSASSPLKDGVAGVDVTLDFAKVTDDDFTIYFTASAKGKYGNNFKVPLEQPIVDRWIIFEEAIKFVEVVGNREHWDPGPAKNRWIYVFGSLDGNKYSDVWEIKTDSNGKFSTYKLTADNYETRPETGSFEDVAFLPANDDSGKKYTYLAALSEFRLPKERIFDGSKSLVSSPKARCLNIDDDQQVARKTDETGEEHVILINYLKRAEKLRADFDATRKEWEALRLPSSAESNEENKKQKLLMEFGALINTVLEAFPKYKKQLSEEGYQRLQSDLHQYETEKAKKTGEIGGKVLLLCDWIDTEKFAETCRDYLALIANGDDQPQAWYDFEDRIGTLLEGLTRFPRGQETLGTLLKKTSNVKENSWLQDLLLLKNDTWNSDGEQLFNEDDTIPPSKTYDRIRKLSQRFIDILAEAARRGASEFKPEEMAKILQKVLRTSGAYFGMELIETTVRNRPAVKPFADVLGGFTETSFWRFGFDKSISYENAAAKFITSDGLDKLLKTLEGVSVVFAVKEFLDKKPKNGMEALDRYNNLAGVVSFFAENLMKVKYRGKWVKLGTGPFQAVNFVSSGIDMILAIDTGNKEFNSKDIDSAVWNYIAAGGFFISAVGSGALAATFFAGAAGLSATGIGIAPGLVLAVVGTVIAIGSKTMADISNNSKMEDLLLKTPWGTHAESSLKQVTLSKVNNQYIQAVQILNTFSVDLDVGKQTAEIQLRRLEPETRITLKEVVFATSASGKYQEITVGKDILLNAANAIIRNSQQATCVCVSLATICGIESDTFWMANRPDFIRVRTQVDLFGDTKVSLPDKGKSLSAQCYAGQKTETKIQ